MAALVVMAMVGQLTPFAIPPLNTSLVYASVVYMLITGAVISTQGRLSGLHSAGDQSNTNNIMRGGLYFIATTSLSITGASYLYFSSTGHKENEELIFTTTLFLTSFPLGINTLFATYLESIGNGREVSKIRFLQITIQLFLIGMALLASHNFGKDYIILLPIAYLLTDAITVAVFARLTNKYTNIFEWLNPLPESLINFIRQFSTSGIGGSVQKLSFMVLVAHIANLNDNDTKSFFVMTSVFGAASLIMMGMSSALTIEIGKMQNSQTNTHLIKRLVFAYMTLSAAIFLMQMTFPQHLSSAFISEDQVIQRVVDTNPSILLYFFMNLLLCFAMAISRGVGNNNFAQLILTPSMILISAFIYHNNDGNTDLENSIRYFSYAGITSGTLILIHSLFFHKSPTTYELRKFITKRLQLANR